MIEETILEYLEDMLDVPCYLMRPENVPSSFVLIEKTGGSESNKVDHATFAFQSYGATLYDAAALNRTVISAAKDLVTLPSISSSRLQTDYNFTNIADKHPRYQAIFDITYYEEV